MIGRTFRITLVAMVALLIVACADDGELQPTGTPTLIADEEIPDVPARVLQPGDDTETETAQQTDFSEYRIRGGNHEIYVTDLTGERQQRLTESSAMNANPVWSPDGEQIAWVQLGDSGDAPAGLYVANADGSDVRLVTAPAGPRGIDWHPDGDRIAFVSAHETNSGWDEVHIVNLDGSDRRQVTFWEEIPTERQYYGSTYPAFSPDGNRLAVVVDQIDEFEQIYILDIDGDEPARQLTDIPDQQKGRPTWSPDGNQIAFHATPHETHFPRIFLVDVNSGEVSHLTEEVAIPFTEPAWSPDGGQIALVAAEEGMGAQIQVMSPDGGERWQITNDPSGNTSPRWSPDGSQILFVASRDSQLARPCSFHSFVNLGSQRNLDELAWTSHVVLTGTVIEEHPAAWSEPLNQPMDTCLGIYTDYTIEVESQFRGEPAETVRVRLPGGAIGGYQQEFEPSLELAEGDRMLLFLVPDHERELLPDAWTTSGLHAWRIVDDTLQTSGPFGEVQDMSMAEAEQAIRESLAGGPSAPEPHGFVPLDEAPIAE